jgi:UDP-N-acetylmuramate--alanine ligase
VAKELGAPNEAIQQALLQFQGIGRRFQSYGEISTPAGSVLLIDDYGHHPKEVSATIAAIRKGWPSRRLVLAFQPHRYSRTRDLLDDFASTLSAVDVLLVTEVYAAGEEPISGADARALCRAIRTRGQVDPIFVETVEEIDQVLSGVIRDGDILLTSGAGNIGSVAAQLPVRLTGNHS